MRVGLLEQPGSRLTQEKIGSRRSRPTQESARVMVRMDIAALMKRTLPGCRNGSESNHFTIE
jgi:hypothetical protein